MTVNFIVGLCVSAIVLSIVAMIVCALTARSIMRKIANQKVIDDMYIQTVEAHMNIIQKITEHANMTLSALSENWSKVDLEQMVKSKEESNEHANIYKNEDGLYSRKAFFKNRTVEN